MKTFSLTGLELIAAFALLSPALAGNLPEDARRLAEARYAAIERIDEKFVSELEKLKVAHAKRGDLEAANAIAELIHLLPAKEVEQLIGVWKRDRDGSLFEFDGKGGGVFNGKDKFIVQYDREKKRFELQRADWAKNYLSFSDDPAVMDGTVPEIYDFKLTKVQ